MMSNTFLKVFVLVVMCFVSGFAGFLSCEALRFFNNFRVYNGLLITGNYSHSEAIVKAQSYDIFGNWVCVNVKGMSVEKAFDTCRHEVSHELFSTYCGKSKNWDNCLGVIKE